MLLLRRHVLTAATILAAVVWFVALRPASLGGPATYVIVRGTSMTGTLATGDLVFASSQAHYSIGDLVVYRIPSGPARGDLIVHRITGGNESGYATQGDANAAPDSWHPAASDIAGKLTARIPGFGQLFVFARSPFLISTIWAVVAVVLVLALLPARSIRWTYSKVVGLDHWPLAPTEDPSWVTQTVYRIDGRRAGQQVYQVWSGRDRTWVDLHAFDNKAEKSIWFGGQTIEFGDPMVVETTESEAEAFIDGLPGDGHTCAPWRHSSPRSRAA
jgi:signal peptidase